MKKLFITIAALALTISAATAQGLSGGLRVGLNLSNVDFSGGGETLETDSKAGLLGGVFVTFMATEKIGLQAEAQYSIQGFKTTDPDVGDLKMDFSFINVPILFRYNATSFLNIQAGAQIGILAKADASIDDVSVDVKDSFKSSDFTGVLGIGLDLPMGLDAGLRYNLGLSDNVNSDGDFSGAELKNRSFQVYVGYKLFGKK
jgi:hypothetical protein